METTETRVILNEDAEIRMEGDSRTVYGNAIVFNRDSQLIYEDNQLFYERIMPQAMDGIIEKSDIKVWLNHDKSRGLLARSTNGKGSLSVNLDNNSVKYSFEAPKFALGDELVENIKRGDIKGTSFAFRVAEGGEKWMKRTDGAKLRVITKFKMIGDISPCYDPAYVDTTVALRSLQSLKDEEIEPEVLETKSVTEEPVIEPIVERTEPVIEPIVEQRNTNLKNNKMTLEELKDKRAKALEENDKIYEVKTTENRTMTEKEEAQTAQNNQLLKELDLQIETEKRKQGSGMIVGPYINFGKDKEAFSLLKAIRAKVQQREIPGPARDMFLRGLNDFRAAGVNPEGDFFLPLYDRATTNAIVATGSATHGQEIVAEDKLQILPPLMDKLVFGGRATYLTGLVGNVSIPNYSGSSVGWKAEITAVDQGEGTFDEIDLSPKKLGGFITISKQFLLQDSVGAERMLLTNLSNAVTQKLQSTILGVAVGSATQPQGMGYKTTTGDHTSAAKVTPTYATLVGLESAIDGSNALIGNLAYLTNAAGRGILKSIDRGVNNDTGEMLCSENNLVNGYPLLVTNSASAAAGSDSGDLLIFGNWADLCIAQWGGYDITVDPYTMADTGQIKIVINTFFDAKGLRGDAATTTHAGGSAADDYAVSFASCSIKA